MSDFTVFYSWQSDLPRRITRDVVHNAAAAALQRMATGGELDDAPRLDHDTLDVPGAPEIAKTIFDKIERAALFIADVSFVGETTSDDPNKRRKTIPNPNVLIELGYAAAKIGWDRIILVMNTAYGSAEELPFDLVHRRFPIRFQLQSPETIESEKATEMLSSDLELAIKANMSAQHARVADIIERLDEPCIRIITFHRNESLFFIAGPKNIGEALDHGRIYNALLRLIDFGIVRWGGEIKNGDYIGYRWTYLGRLLHDQLAVHVQSVNRIEPNEPHTP